jgi:16S rRNA (guanine527-N7)-methyltransferase
VDPEIAQAQKLSEYFKLIEDHEYRLPETPHERRLIVYQKLKTPPRAEP